MMFSELYDKIQVQLIMVSEQVEELERKMVPIDSN